MDELKKPAFQLIGLKLETKTTNFNGQSQIDCGNLWQQFEKEGLMSRIPAKLEEHIYAVYYDYESNHSGAFSYFIGCKVKAATTPPEGLHLLTIPEQVYFKITAKGEMPDCISDSWKSIWSSEIPRAYTHDFEVYTERSEDWKAAEVDIFVATNRKNNI